MKSIFSLSFVAILSCKSVTDVLARPASSEIGSAENWLLSFTKQFLPAGQFVIAHAPTPLSNGFAPNTNVYPHGGHRGVNTDGPLALTTTAHPTFDHESLGPGPEKPIPGKYIHPNDDFTKCLGASSNSITAHVELYECPTVSGPRPPHLVWELSGGAFRIFGNMCLDDMAGVKDDGQKMQLWNCSDGHSNQQWSAKRDGTIQLVTAKGKCLDNTEGRMTVGNPAQIWSCTGGSNQKWSIVDADVRGFQLKPSASASLCVTAVSNEDEAEVEVRECDWSIGQTWNTYDGTLQTFGNKCLEVPNGSTSYGLQLRVTTCLPGDPNQKWTSPDGQGQVQWTDMRRCMGLYGNYIQPGTRIYSWSCNGQTPQIWDYVSIN